MELGDNVTPAADAANSGGIEFLLHEDEHDPAAASYGFEAAARLGLSGDEVFKTLVVVTETGELAVGIVPVSRQLSQKAIGRAAGAKKTEMADVARVERVTGYLAGGVSPLGQKRRLATFIDASAEQLPRIYVSGGRRGLEISLAPQDLARLVPATFAAIAVQEKVA